MDVTKETFSNETTNLQKHFQELIYLALQPLLNYIQIFLPVNKLRLIHFLSKLLTQKSMFPLIYVMLTHCSDKNIFLKIP